MNKVTPHLFKEFKTPQLLARASNSRVEELIHSTGFFKNKAKNIIGCAQVLVEKYNGEIPRNIDQLVSLPGVGRKTANVVLGNAFGIISGIVVDTHVLRLANRFGWIKTSNPEIAERKLIKFVPHNDWIAFSHWMIHHGRGLCSARSPKCGECFLRDLCPSANE